MNSSVREQLISDVPLGGFLSGGLDSAILATLAHRLTQGNYNAYSVGYDRMGYQEWTFVREATNSLGMTCEEVCLRDQDYASVWKSLVREKGMPLSTPNEVAIFELAKSLRQEYTVALSGEGADEVFGGYVIPYFSSYDYTRARRQPPSRGEPLTPFDRALIRVYRRPYLFCRPDHYFLINSWVPFSEKQALFKPGLWKQLDRDEAVFDHYESAFKQLEKCSTFDAYMHMHARINLEGLLSRVDSSTMAASVEARVPFTDHRLVEYLFTLPDHYKMDWRNSSCEQQASALNIFEIDRHNLLDSKIVLRRAFQDQIPTSILNRRKMSFPVPFQEWMAGNLHGFISEAIHASSLVRSLFRKEQVHAHLKRADQPISAMALWPLANLALWDLQCNAASG